MDKKKKQIANLCIFLFFLFFAVQTMYHREFTEETIYEYYDRLMEGFFPSYQNKQQPIYGTVLSGMISAYRTDFLPILKYSEDYKKTSESDLVSEEYYHFEDDETTDKNVEEVAKEGKNFHAKSWENPGYLRKYIYQVDSTTMVTNSEINGKVLMNMDLSLKKTTSPQILIYHTHGSETYKDSRAGKKSDTVIGVGDELTRKLQAKGISVLHDRNIYDIKNGKEERSKAYNYAADAIESHLAKYPGIQVVIDLHRDGVGENVKLETTQNGEKMAQIMFFNGLSRTASNGDLAYLKNPNKKINLAFSLQLQAQAMKKYPGFTRKIYMKGYRYNLHYRGRSLLVEVGAQNNTVRQAKASMSLLAELLNSVLY